MRAIITSKSLRECLDAGFTSGTSALKRSESKLPISEPGLGVDPCPRTIDLGVRTIYWLDEIKEIKNRDGSN